MNDFHSTTMWSQQLTRLKGSATRCEIITEDFRHPMPSSTQGLVYGPVEDLEARLLIFYVLFLKMFKVSVFCVTSLTTHRVFTTVNGALEIIS